VLERRSVIPAPAHEVWIRITSPEGINDELMPVMRMTVPRSLRGQTIDRIPLGRRLGRSVFLLFGILPFDVDNLVIAELDPGRRFRETSTMLSMRRWEHERTVTPRGSETEVHDRVVFQPRLPVAAVPGAARLLAAGLGRLFAHRHRRLARHFARPVIAPPAE
jgi:ligand-binding SRPBCC domain-containing protein